jgi:hypothetical protein
MCDREPERMRKRRGRRRRWKKERGEGKKE